MASKLSPRTKLTGNTIEFGNPKYEGGGVQTVQQYKLSLGLPAWIFAKVVDQGDAWTFFKGHFDGATKKADRERLWKLLSTLNESFKLERISETKDKDYVVFQFRVNQTKHVKLLKSNLFSIAITTIMAAFADHMDETKTNMVTLEMEEEEEKHLELEICNLERDINRRFEYYKEAAKKYLHKSEPEGKDKKEGINKEAIGKDTEE